MHNVMTLASLFSARLRRILSPIVKALLVLLAAVTVTACHSPERSDSSIDCNIVPASVYENLRQYCIETDLNDYGTTSAVEIEQCLARAIPAVQQHCRTYGEW